MVAMNQVVREIETLPNEYFQEVLDFVGYLKQNRLKKIPDTMLLSEQALAKEWDTPEEDTAWASL